MISHHRPCGRWCFARLIRQAETLELQLHSQPPSKRTALSPLKRSCFRFAALTLRCRTEPALRAAPVFRSAYFPKKLFSFFSKTLDLQPLRGLRWAGEASLSPCSAPKCPFRTFRCFAWLIQLRQRTALSPLKRSCFRFAALTLRCRTPLSCPSRTDLSSVQKTPHLFSDGQTGCSSARTILFPLPG